MKVRAKKRLGQHFLTDLSIARQIADSLTGDRAMYTLEVGPGMGVLTQFLLEREEREDLKGLNAVEIDTESVAYLHEHYPKLKVIEGDFLRMDLQTLFGGKPLNVIGNFPYNISSQIFFKVLDYRELVPEVVGMIQKEVAERLASGPGRKEYGILSVLLQAYYDIEYLFTVSEHVFSPPPKVKSAVIRLTRNEVERLDCDEALFKRIVKGTFGQRRKMIRNSILSTFPEIAKKTDATHPFFTMRPEQLSVAQFVELTNWVSKQIG